MGLLALLKPRHAAPWSLFDVTAMDRCVRQKSLDTGPPSHYIACSRTVGANVAFFVLLRAAHMTKRPQGSALDLLIARGGGNATAAGVEFEANLGAWFAARLLSERPLDLRLSGERVLSLRFETEAPVDDILVETVEGWIFVQAKTSLSLSSNPRSELGKTVEQFVRQWLACSTGDGSRGWNRPLRRDRDRFLLALGPQASKSLSTGLAQGLAALQAAGSAPLSQSKADAVGMFDGLVGQAWKEATGHPASATDIRLISNLVTILTFDFDGADRQAGAEILAHVLDPPAQASAAFSAIAQYCQVMMRQRTGCDMPELRRALAAMGVPLAAPPSYRADVASLRAYSDHVRKQLSDYEATKVAGAQVRIERRCTDAVVEAARAGSLLLVGEPGAGKSAVINASAAKLKKEGHDVLELAVDRLPVKSLPDLAAELGLTHPLREVLLNWPGDRPAFLFIDALDATRGGENEAVFRTLIADVLTFETRRWHVIASIRTFDLRLGEQFRHLFSGSPPSTEFAEAAFPGVRHIHVPPWAPAELAKLLQDAPALATAIEAGGERLHELALVPFNTRLLADLISGGMAPAAFGEVQSQVQLLALYWNNRVEKHGTGAELCLQAAVSQMVSTRSLRAEKLNAARPDPAAFDALLHDSVLVPLKQDQFVAFRHHILFDYAASRVYLHPDDVAGTAILLTHGNGLGLMLAPALGFALQQLWDDAERGHRRFWETVASLSGDPACDPVARSVAARTASELPRVPGDAIELLANLSAQGGLEARAATALSHVVGALVVRFEDKQSVSLDPWTELAERASERVEDTAWPLRSLLYALYERVTSDTNRMQLGRAARAMLAYCLDTENVASQLTASAIDFVATTYSSDIEGSRGLLRRLFDPQHFQDRADQEIPSLTRKLKPISDADPDFLADIYAGSFGASISDGSPTSLGHSQILPLSSNRRQDYESAWWDLKEFFPSFLVAHPVHAARALILAISGYVAREHSISKESRAWTIPTPAGEARLQEDRSYLWAWDIEEEHGDNAHGLIKAFVRHLEGAEPDVARVIVQEIITRNALAVLWSRTLMAASKRPEVFGALWRVATQEPFLRSLDTEKDAIDFIAARYPLELASSRESFEHTAMGFRFPLARRPDKAREEFLSKLFSCIGERNLATREARSFLPKEEADTTSRSLNTRPFSIVTTSGSPEKWWWLARDGVDLEAADVVRILTETDEVKLFLGLEQREGEIADIHATIDRLTNLVDVSSSASQSVPASVREYAYGVAAQGAAKLSRLPVERLREHKQTLPAIIRLVIRLAEEPAEPSSAEAETSFERSAAWGSPDARVDTAEAVMQLCRLDGAVVEQLRPTMEMLLGVPNPAARMQIAERLAALWNSARPLMWELADRVARTEPNRGVLRFFANYFLGRTVHADPLQVERLAFVLHTRDFNRTDEATQSLFEEIGSLVALLWITHGRDEPRRALQAWIADPHTFEPEFGHAITISREALVLKYKNEAPRDAEITQRAQEFYIWAVTAMADGLERYLAEVQQRQPAEAERDWGTLYAKYLNQLCDQIYFASGAFRSGGRARSPLDSDEKKRAFLFDMQPVLVRIADAGTPGTIHHLIELLDFLSPADPAAVFDLVAYALLGAGRRHRYQFEPLGADRFVEIIGRYLADHRELFTDEWRRQQLVACLDTFLEAGWPAARRLLYRLPELLQ